MSVLLLLTLLSNSVYAERANTWKLVKEGDGITLYSRPVAESAFHETRGILTVPHNMNTVVALLSDFEGFNQWFYQRYGTRLLKRVSKIEHYDYSITKAPWPVADRDLIIHSIFSQLPQSKVIKIELEGVKDYIPQVEGLVRTEHYKGSWIITPLEKNLTEIIFYSHAEPGGSLPAWLVNMSVVDIPFNSLVALKKQLTLSKYQGITDLVEEKF
jgi:hypothetical protein